MRHTLIFIFLFSLIALSCEEEYKPEIEEVEEVLVVDGLISDEDMQHTVLLSKATPFNSQKRIPEIHARVLVVDSSGNAYPFTETSPGRYVSDPYFFQAETGNSYTLWIETQDGKTFQSAKQKLLQKGSIPALSNRHKFIQRYTYSGNEKRTVSVKGTEFIATFNLQAEPDPFFRFSNTILVEYTEVTEGERLSYCWKKFNINEIFNVNDQKYGTSGIFQHNLGFCPLDTSFYGVSLGVKYPTGINPVYIHRSLKKYVISFKQYHLNKDVFDYYVALNKQLEAKQRIFDPVNAQVSGNITCVSHPGEMVFGIFEASSVNVTTYIIEDYIMNSAYHTIEIPPFDLDTIPFQGTGFEPPHFWIY